MTVPSSLELDPCPAVPRAGRGRAPRRPPAPTITAPWAHRPLSVDALERALTHRLRLVGPHCYGIGHHGAWYEVRLEPTLHCTCPDAAPARVARRGLCSHVLAALHADGDPVVRDAALTRAMRRRGVPDLATPFRPMTVDRLQRALACEVLQEAPEHYAVSHQGSPHHVQLAPHFECECADWAARGSSTIVGLCKHLLAALLAHGDPIVHRAASDLAAALLTPTSDCSRP